MKNKKIAIIIAGGSGHRMGQDIPKQFLTVNEKPVIIEKQSEKKLQIVEVKEFYVKYSFNNEGKQRNELQKEIIFLITIPQILCCHQKK